MPALFRHCGLQDQQTPFSQLHKRWQLMGWGYWAREQHHRDACHSLLHPTSSEMSSINWTTLASWGAAITRSISSLHLRRRRKEGGACAFVTATTTWAHPHHNGEPCRAGMQKQRKAAGLAHLFTASRPHAIKSSGCCKRRIPKRPAPGMAAVLLSSRCVVDKNACSHGAARHCAARRRSILAFYVYVCRHTQPLDGSVLYRSQNRA
jgi:hypothetical protein